MEETIESSSSNNHRKSDDDDDDVVVVVDAGTNPKELLVVENTRLRSAMVEIAERLSAQTNEFFERHEEWVEIVNEHRQKCQKSEQFFHRLLKNCATMKQGNLNRAEKERIADIASIVAPILVSTKNNTGDDDEEHEEHAEHIETILFEKAKTQMVGFLYQMNMDGTPVFLCLDDCPEFTEFYQDEKPNTLAFVLKSQIFRNVLEQLYAWKPKQDIDWDQDRVVFQQFEMYDHEIVFHLIWDPMVEVVYQKDNTKRKEKETLLGISHAWLREHGLDEQSLMQRLEFDFEKSILKEIEIGNYDRATNSRLPSSSSSSIDTIIYKTPVKNAVWMYYTMSPLP
jgi:hypothetical protein